MSWLGKLFIVCALLFSCTESVFAKVWINEISPSTNPEWFELYNDGEAEVDLTGWTVKDAVGVTSVLSGTINSKSVLVITHSDGWLNNTGGDTLTLSSNATESAIIDQHTFGTIQQGQSVARYPDGGSNWAVGTPSEGASNPTPTPSPSPNPSPASSQAPSPSPSPSPSPVRSPTPSPSPRSSSTRPSPILVVPSPNVSSPPVGTVAGTTDVDLSSFENLPSPLPNSQVKEAEDVGLKLNQSRAKTAILVGSGLIIIAATTYLGYRKYRDSTIIS